MSLLSRFRERLVLGQVRRSFGDGEHLLAWAHVRVPGTRAPGVIYVTDERCVVHVASRHLDDRGTSWEELGDWRVEHPARGRARLTLHGHGAPAVGELSLNSRARARSATRVVEAISLSTDVPWQSSVARSLPSRGAPQLHATPRGFRDHVRRAGLTVVGLAALLVGVLLASPGVPGPGSVVVIAGVAILAREYEWAGDLYVWGSRQLDRFLAWLERRRGPRGPRRAQSSQDGTDAPPSSVERAA